MANESIAGPSSPFEALGDPTRRTIFELVCRGPRSVGELAGAVPVSRPAVSQHLRVLKDAGLVTDRAAGTRRIYTVAVTGVEQLRTYVEGLWDTALAGFTSAVEEEARIMQTEHAASERSTVEPVRKSILVDAPVALAFEVFTNRLAEWWPLATHSIGDQKTQSAYIEGRVGGRIYEIQHDGTEADWGIISAWDPPAHFAVEWKVNRDAQAPTVIDVRFSEDGGKTRVELVHSHWERLGAGGREARDGYNSGWDLVLNRYVDVADAAGQERPR